MRVLFVETDAFRRRVDALALHDGLRTLQMELDERPDRGAVDAGTGGPAKSMTDDGTRGRRNRPMKKTLFFELMKAAGEAMRHAEGKRDLRTTVLPDAPHAMNADDIRRMREQLHSSQAVFARFLNVSTQLVQAWESSRRRPDGAALRLLEVGRAHPAVVFGGLTTNVAGTATRGTNARTVRRVRRALK